MAKLIGALALVLVGVVLLFELYLLLRYLLVADSLRKILNRSSGDGLRRS